MLARLRPAGALVLIHYPHNQDAGLAYKRFSDTFKDDEGKFSAAKASGSLLAIVLSAGSKGEALEILGGIKP